MNKLYYIKMDNNFEMAYTYNDVTLIPRYSEIISRLDTSLKTKLTKNLLVDMPLIPSNMDTVISNDLAKIVINKGGIPIYHRFCSFNEQKEFVLSMNGLCFISSGIKTEDLANAKKLLDLGALGVCLDIAHGHCKSMIDAIKNIKFYYPNKDIIAGNVCTQKGYLDLCMAGADAIKVGVGSGSICTTRMVTGHGIPMFSAIYNISKIKFKDIPIIADGGIVNNRDVVLALAAGADTVMIGNLYARTMESAGEKFIKDNKTYKIYRGQASKEFQMDFYGELRNGITPEGISGFIECNKSAENFIDEFCGGIKSGLTYSGVKSIADLHINAKFAIAHSTNSFMFESNTRI